MSDINKKWLKFRLASVLVVFILLYIALLSRAFQLQVLTSENLKRLYNQQHAKALEARQLVKDLQHSLDKLNDEQKKQITDAIALGVEKATLQKEIAELKPKYDKLSKDIQVLQNTLKDLSVLQEKQVGQIVKIMDQNFLNKKWPNFFMSFMAGILTSLIASAIYSSVIVRRVMSSMGKFIKNIKDRLVHLKKNAEKNGDESSI